MPAKSAKSPAALLCCTVATPGAAAVREYVESGEPMDKAGGYGIQGFAGAFVRQIHGCYHNVVGFPMHRFCEEVEVARLRPM